MKYFCPLLRVSRFYSVPLHPTAMKHRIIINGLRHHDFKGRLDELYKLAPGRRMAISIEHDNPKETDAVIVYWGKELVGYVRSGKDRELAYTLIKTSGRCALLGKITGVVRDKRWLLMEINAQDDIPLKVEHKPSVLDDWHFDGKLLPSDEEELRLHTMLCNIETTVEQQEPWDDDMEQWLDYTKKNLWRDISCETYQQVGDILDLLTKGTKTHPEYEQKAGVLQVAIDAMGSPEVRRLQALQIIQKAKAKEMDKLLIYYDDKASDCISQLPQVLSNLFMKDGEELMGRLWYLHRPYRQIQELKTLLAMTVRLNDEAKASTTTPSISEQWLITWGTLQKDKAKAEVVREIIETFEMEHSNPELARQMQRMMDGCNAPMQQADAINRQTEALKTMAAKPATQINQLNMGNGTQQMPPDINIPKLPEQ